MTSEILTFSLLEESFRKYETSMDQIFIIDGVIFDHEVLNKWPPNDHLHNISIFAILLYLYIDTGTS